HVINPTVPIEREDEIKLDDHEYDGIVELGNKMPPWLQFLFYVTILFAVVYAPYYLLGYGRTMDEKYQDEVQLAQLVKEEKMKNSLNFMDENTVVVMATSEVLSAGKEIFTTYCVACHGNAGEGGVGPNMTDQYWLHGGSINDIFRTVKYGVPEKGMAAWQEILMPKQISEVANYILSLQGTNPPNAMPPQGDLYTPATENTDAGTDTTQTVTDTVSVAYNAQ
ncbi:MAG TPA: cytochrome C oxidase subunit III, partial [Bacteroidetes bacterium]|nr:cytochrome C oxidase subunit III [Bacteroidota bacterium]